MKKVIGYGLCGPGEAGRYMRETLECFKRLCDEVIILCNNCDQAELNLIDEYGFKRVNDRREWGTHQWRIKQDFIERDIKQMANEGDVLVCLDMDEVLSERCTKEWLLEAPLDAYHVFIVDLWNDPQHFKPESCFWNVRIWKWNGETKFKAKPVHCGLAPEWTYHYHRHAPFLLMHKGLMAESDRLRKIKRYEKYDPNAEHLSRVYYDMLKSNTARPLDENALADQIAEEVATYNQTKPRQSMVKKPKPRFAYVKNPHGEVVDIPEKHLARTLKQKGFEFINWADEEQEEIESMFEDDDEVGVVPGSRPHPEVFKTDQGSYQRSAQDEKEEVENLNAITDRQMAGFSAPVHTPVDEEEVDAMFNDDEKEPSGEATTVTSENVGEVISDAKNAIDSLPPAPKKTVAKKAAKKTAAKNK